MTESKALTTSPKGTVLHQSELLSFLSCGEVVKVKFDNVETLIANLNTILLVGMVNLLLFAIDDKVSSI